MLRKFALLSLMLFIALIFTSACGSGGSGSCDFFGYPNTNTENPQPAPETKTITLSKYKFTLDVGTTDKIIAYVNGIDKTNEVKYTPIKEEFTKDTVATVERGLITALKAGTSIFKVSYTGADSVNFTVTVNDPTLPTLEVVKNEINLEYGADPSDIESIIVTLDGKDVTHEATFTSSDESVATVDKNGNINIVGEGETQIIIHLDGANDQVVTIKVTLPELEINKDEVNLQVGEEAQTQQKDTDDLTVKLRGEDKIGEATFTSSDESVATVDENGHITAVSEGEAIITVSVDGAKKSEVKVNVYDPDLHKIILQSNSLVSLQVGQTEQITILIKDQDKTAQAKYTIEDDTVISVSNTGLITALKEGTTKIKVHLDDTEADIEITVDVYDPALHTLHYTSSLPTQIVDNEQYMVMYEGETGHIQILVGGVDKTDSGSYTSGNTTILTVDNDNEGEHEKGKIYAIKEGKTTINLHHEEALEGDVVVNVLVKPMPNVEQNQFTIIQGYSEQIRVFSNNGVDITSRCTFESEDPTIATVDSTGKVTLVGTGSTTVYAIYDDKRVPVTITELKTVQNSQSGLTSTVLSASETDRMIKVLLDTGMISNENDVNNIVSIDNSNGLTQIIIYIDRPDGTQLAVISNENGTLRYISTETVQNGQVSVNVGSSIKNKIGDQNEDGTITTVVKPGFYNANNELLAEWDTVVSWGWNPQVTVDWGTYQSNSSDLYNIMQRHTNLKNATKLVIPDSLTSIGNSLWGVGEIGSKINTIVVPNALNCNLSSSFLNATSLNLQNITIRSDNPYFESIDGVAYTEDLKTICVCPTNKSKLVIPNTVTTINGSCFQYNTCRSIGPVGSGADIQIPNSVTKIGGWILSAAPNIVYIEIPDSVQSISALGYDNPNLKSIYIPNTLTTISSVFDTLTNSYRGIACYANSNVVIYTNASSKLIGWNNYWNLQTHNPYSYQTVRYNTSRATYEANYRN